MNGWIVQRYANEPAELNVAWKLPPAPRVPESHPPPVVVWGDAPVFVQSTESPTAIVSDGTAKSMMLTACACGAGVPVGAGVAVGVGEAVAVGTGVGVGVGVAVAVTAGVEVACGVEVDVAAAAVGVEVGV